VSKTTRFRRKVWPEAALSALGLASALVALGFQARAAPEKAAGGTRPSASALPTAGQDPAAKAFASIERAESLFKSYVARSSIEFFDDGEKKKTMGLLLAISADSSIALMKSPKYDSGKAILVNSDGYFLYFPTPDRYIRVSPQNSLYGNISFGDIVKPPLLRYYSLASSRADGARVELTFELKPGVKLPYFRKIVYFDIKQSVIVQMDSLSRSGILLGRITNLEFQEIQGVRFASYSKIQDVKNPNSFAYQRYTGVKAVELPGAFFTPTYLREVDSYFDRRLGM
jgi:hypothetical protein